MTDENIPVVGIIVIFVACNLMLDIIPGYIQGLQVLTHWGLGMPYGDTDLGQHWVR